VVRAEVADNFRSPKIIVFKYKAKVRYRKFNTHRQDLTRLVIRDILPTGVPETAEEETTAAPPAPVGAEGVAPVAAEPTGPVEVVEVGPEPARLDVVEAPTETVAPEVVEVDDLPGPAEE
jgi:hypothetical protein